ncbi:MAG: nucleotidyl transferase AbiEii/AbiGii toxin family protein [bacterium]|nr:nucleotidyl transferase AbiEii/AbiGii toxin family protein [bacterium]
MDSSSYYFNVLYPFQDRVIKITNQVDTEFYLSGGTAASRGYLEHRFSDDLDYFVNDDSRFGLWTERLLQAFNSQWKCEVIQKEERFARFNLIEDSSMLKIELINDVPARAGKPQKHPLLGRIDNAENILANKITALLDRNEPKDLADIWGFCCVKELNIQDAIANAQGKAAGVFPADLGRALCSVSKADWQAIRWIDAPSLDDFVAQLNKLGESLLLPGSM